MTIYTHKKARILGHTLDASPYSQLQVESEEVSDGYHTMEELYEHRIALFIALLRILDKYITPLSPPFARCWKSEYHNDNSRYDGWFIAGITVKDTPWTGPIKEQYITYHLPIKYWNRVEVMSLPKAPPFDGFTPQDVIERLLKL